MSHRDDVRAARNELNKRTRALGIVMEAERARVGANARTLGFESLKRMNDDTARTNREVLVTDDPPAGIFDSANTIFTLSAPVDGENIRVVFGDASVPQTIPLVKGNQNPPPSGSFYFSTLDPTQIVVGDPPAPEDRLIAIFKVR